ncbi:hypothetical protein [Glycomyces xiaoerkulensis]|uniref:hypothetical protein n=1 Tax=Glycomyces xiaoerkulensis TaxID=2038139 RepID=UPI0012FFDBF6|nr:hypothetical protein [Glycomyces xiaoerkulensis]
MSGVLMTGALAACGGGQGGGEETATPTTTSEAPTGAPAETGSTEPEPTDTEESEPMPDDETTPRLDPSAGSDKSGPKSEMTIGGTVESGVESGCLILEHKGTVYGIFGEYDESVVYAGAEVTLHGHTDPGMMSFCQQGTPFVVEEAESAG